MIWALDGAGRRRGRGGRPARPTPTRSRPCCASATTRGSRSPRPRGRSGVCGASVPRPRRRRARPARRCRGIVDVDDDVAGASTCCPGTFGDAARGRAARRARRDARALAAVDRRSSTVGGWLACRGAGQYSTRYGKIEDIVVGPRRRARRRHASCTPAARRAPRSGPTSPSSSSAREGTLGVITGARLRVHPAPAARAPRGVRVRRRSPTGSTRAAASCSGARRPRCCASTTRSRPTAATRPATAAACCSCSTRATPTIVDATHGGRRTRSARPRDALDDARSSSSGSSTATTSSALEALITQGFVVDTMEIAAPLVGAARASTTRRSRPCSRRRRHARGVRAPVATRTPTARCLYFTFARPPADRTQRRATTTAARGTPAQRAVLAARRRAQPPPRRRPQPRPVRRRGARRRLRRARRDEGTRSTRTAS